MNDFEREECPDFTRTQMKKEAVLQKLKERGGRVTRQRRLLLDIIMEEQCSCCKEIYYKAVKSDPGIGAATVYRMVNTLEEIGAIRRSRRYEIQYEDAGRGFGKLFPENDKMGNVARYFQELLMEAGVEPEQAANEAHGMECVLCEESARKMEAYVEKEREVHELIEEFSL